MYGNGIIESKDFHYRGEVKNGLFHGFGRLELKHSNLVHYGNFCEGKKEGFGQEFQAYCDVDEDVVEFEGHWKDDKKNGIGKETIKNDKKDRIKITENVWKDDIIVEQISCLQAIKSKSETDMINKTRFHNMISQINEQKEDLCESIDGQNKILNIIDEKMQILNLNQKQI